MGIRAERDNTMTLMPGFVAWLRDVVCTDTVWFMVFMLGACGSRVVASHVFPTYDDAFITYRYAVNAVEHGQFVYNLGEWVLGTTAPLFALLQCLPGLLHIPHPVFTVVLNTLCDCLSSLALVYMAESIGIRRTAMWPALTLFLFCNPSLARISVGGMEVNLFALLCLLSVIEFERGRAVRACAIMSAAYFLRPESVVLVCVFGVMMIRRGQYARMARSVATSIAIVAPVLAVMQWRYGSFLPQSVQAKSQVIARPILETLRVFVAPEPITAVTVVLCLFAVSILHRRDMLRGAPMYLLLTASMTILAYAAARPQVWSWYANLCILAFTFGASMLLVLFAENRMKVWFMAIPLPVMTSLLLGVGPSRVHINVYTPMKAFCSQTELDTVLAQDIGAIGYYSPTVVIDGNALVTPSMDAKSSLTEKILRYKPAYVLANNWRVDAACFANPIIASRYRPVVRFNLSPPSPEYSPEPLPAYFTDAWIQAYTVYKRVDVGN